MFTPPDEPSVYTAWRTQYLRRLARIRYLCRLTSFLFKMQKAGYACSVGYANPGLTPLAVPLLTFLTRTAAKRDKT
ncbi:hypothetical protein HMPREF9080_01688 [Cardiobacterium valvarum F0432]|uniref:Uncharacterized protein n=1 Tax=Cardiobacterium valvarum F0432 TaxID=797473 RepID=G9ZFY8_9GAMM|nr:hypothetical protein HMPREF9080_01688 [Cardiobacterium valvarum F0432]